MTKIIKKLSCSSKISILEISKFSFKSKSIYTLLPTKSAVTDLCSLPDEVLEKVVTKLSITNWSNVRATCTHLRDVCNAKLKHDFKKLLYQCITAHPNDIDTIDYGLIKLIDDMTYIYKCAGFESIFLGTLLPFMQKNIQNPMNILLKRIKRIKLFLRHFYQLVDDKLRHGDLQKNTLLFILTLLSVLKKCTNCEMISSKCLSINNWNVIFELKDVWFGVLYSAGVYRSKTFDFTQDRYDLLIILSEVLIGNNLNYNFKKVWEGTRKVIICGRETEKKINPKTIYQLNIITSETLLKIILDFYGNQQIDFSELPADKIDINVKITCREAVKYGCCLNYYFNIGTSYAKKVLAEYDTQLPKFSN